MDKSSESNPYTSVMHQSSGTPTLVKNCEYIILKERN